MYNNQLAAQKQKQQFLQAVESEKVTD